MSPSPRLFRPRASRAAGSITRAAGKVTGVSRRRPSAARVANLDAVAEWVFGHPSLDAEKIGLLGSSFGGSTSLVKAARDRRIRCLSLWATPYLLEKKDDRSLSEIEFKETLYADFARVRPSCRGKKGLMRPRHPRGGRRGGPLAARERPSTSRRKGRRNSS